MHLLGTSLSSLQMGRNHQARSTGNSVAIETYINFLTALTMGKYHQAYLSHILEYGGTWTYIIALRTSTLKLDINNCLANG